MLLINIFKFYLLWFCVFHIEYFIKKGDTFKKLEVETDYNIGDTIEGIVYNKEVNNGDNANYVLLPPKEGNAVVIIYCQKIKGKQVLFMYKFTNGVVVYDEITRDKYINAGMILVKEDKPVKKEDKEIVKGNSQSDTKRNEFRGTRKRTERFSRNFKQQCRKIY